MLRGLVLPPAGRRTARQRTGHATSCSAAATRRLSTAMSPDLPGGFADDAGRVSVHILGRTDCMRMNAERAGTRSKF